VDIANDEIRKNPVTRTVPNFVDVVATDLRWLLTDWDHSVDDQSLRRSSPVLRRLLVEDDLGKAWRLVGFTKQPIIRAVSLDALLEHIPLGNVILGAAGGVITRHGEAQITLSMRPWPGMLANPRLMEVPPLSELPLHAFMSATAMVINGKKLSRRELVKYVANKCGGAHFDEDRDETEDEAVRELEATEWWAKVSNQPIMYYELLSIGQAVAKAPDVARFLEKVATTSK
jgi:hypothetical protein